MSTHSLATPEHLNPDLRPIRRVYLRGPGAVLKVLSRDILAMFMTSFGLSGFDISNQTKNAVVGKLGDAELIVMVPQTMSFAAMRGGLTSDMYFDMTGFHGELSQHFAAIVAEVQNTWTKRSGASGCLDFAPSTLPALPPDQYTEDRLQVMELDLASRDSRYTKNDIRGLIGAVRYWRGRFNQRCDEGRTAVLASDARERNLNGQIANLRAERRELYLDLEHERTTSCRLGAALTQVRRERDEAVGRELELDNKAGALGAKVLKREADLKAMAITVNTLNSEVAQRDAEIARLKAALARIEMVPMGAPIPNLNTLRDAAHANSRSKGFWNEQRASFLQGVLNGLSHEVAEKRVEGPLDRDAVLKTIPEKLCLIHSEVSEALECYRETGSVELSFEGWRDVPPGCDEEGMVYCDACKSLACQRASVCHACGPTAKPKKPVGFTSELADVLIRIFDLAGALGIDLDEAVRVKMKYNASRARMHGKVC